MRAPRQLPGPVAAGIGDRLASLNPSEAKVARVLLELGDELIHHSATEVAGLAETALSTVVRTCQVLGFKGFQDLKVALAREGRPVTPAEIQDDVLPTDRPPVILRKVAAAAREAVTYGLAHIDAAAFERAAEALAGARRVLCLAVGTSAALARDVAYRLMWLGVAAEASDDVHVQHVRASNSQPGDVALVVNHTGSTRESVAAARAAAQAGATVVAVTSFPRSPLTDCADVVLVAASRETSYRVEALTSRIAHLMVLDALWVAVAVAKGEEALAHTRRISDIIADHRY